jgi:hypothetical protein
MFSGLVNIWNYFSENVTALRMRDKENTENMKKEGRKVPEM